MTDVNTYRYELKIQALNERIGQLAVDYENRIADLRVELTIVNTELAEIKEKNDPVQEEEDTTSIKS